MIDHSLCILEQKLLFQTTYMSNMWLCRENLILSMLSQIFLVIDCWHSETEKCRKMPCDEFVGRLLVQRWHKVYCSVVGIVDSADYTSLVTLAMQNSLNICCKLQ